VAKKSDAPDILIKFLGDVKSAFGFEEIKIMRSDNGGEFTSREFEALLRESNIFHELTTSYSPQSNGIAERLNRKILEMLRCMLYASGAPKSFWAEGAEYAVYVLNSLPHSSNERQMSPFEAWGGEKPDISQLFTWGCPAYVMIPMERRQDKISVTSVEGVAVGVARGKKGYRVLECASGRVSESMDVVLDEEFVTAAF